MFDIVLSVGSAGIDGIVTPVASTNGSAISLALNGIIRTVAVVIVWGEAEKLVMIPTPAAEVQLV